MAACEYFGKLNLSLFLNWACYNIYVNLDGLTTIIMETLLRWCWMGLHCLLLQEVLALENIIFLLTFDWMVCQIISSAKYVCHKANFGF